MPSDNPERHSPKQHRSGLAVSQPDKYGAERELKLSHHLTEIYYLEYKFLDMRTLEIKRKLIKEINLSDNKDLLEELYRFLNLENEIVEPYKLSEEQQSAVEEARNQIKAGDYLTNDDANQEIDQWLDKESGTEERKKIGLIFPITGIKETNRAFISKA